MSAKRNPLAELRDPPPAPAADADIESLLDHAERHLQHFAALFDAIADDAWRATPHHGHLPSIAPAPHADATSLVELLCFLRDEEAWVVGRRIAQLFQEPEPEFEHLTFARARDFAIPPYGDEPPGRVFGEFFKSRMAWLQLARGERELLITRRGILPREEGGGPVTWEDHLRATIARDRDACRLALAMRRSLGI
jgi:hypothetical protein